MTERPKARGWLLDAVVVGLWLVAFCRSAEAVVPMVVGPLQALLAILPSLLLGVGGLLLAAFRPSGAKRLVRFLWHQKLFTCLLILVAAGVVVLAQQGAGRGGAAATEVREGTDWPAFRGGPLRRGASPGTAEPTTGDPAWSFDREARTIYASPALVGNRIYVATADKGAFSDRGAILCLDAETGAEVWRYAPEGYRATFSSPSVKGGYIVCGEGLHDTTDARITCLDTNGRLVWQLRTKSHVESSACIYDGRAYIGAGDDGYYCVELEPGADGEPRVVWHLAGERYRDCESSPAAADGVVYFGLGHGGNAICAVDAKTGAELWRISTPYPVFGPPTLAGGKLYVGMGYGNFVQTAEQVQAEIAAAMREAGRPQDEIAAAIRPLGPAGEIWCVDLKTHKVDWKFQVSRTVLGALALGEGRLYFGSRDGHFYCISTAGKLVRRWDARAPIMTSPALGKEHVYFATLKGRLHCLAADTLKPVWDVPLGDGDHFLSSPTLGLGHVYIGTAANGLRCIGRVQEKLAPLWADGARGGADRSPLIEAASVAWRYPQRNPRRFRVTAPLMLLERALYVPCTRAGKPELIKLRTEPGLTDEGRTLWSCPVRHPIRVPPAGLGDSLFAVDGEPGQKGRALHCIGAEDGRQRWRFPVEPAASGQFTLDRRHLFLWSGREQLTCLPVGVGKAPTPRWSVRLGRGVGAPASPADGILVVATASALFALDDQTGRTLWRAALEAAPLFGPVRMGRAVFLPLPRGVALHSILDGSQLWTGIRERATAPLATAPGRIAALTKSGRLVVFSVKDGRVLARVPAAGEGPPALLVGQSALFASRNLMVWSSDAAEPRQWARTSLLGRPLTPLIWSSSHAYFATDRRGVICLGPLRE